MYTDNPHERCDWVQAVVDDYVDGNLPDKEAALLTEHCAECESCAVELELALAVKDGLDALSMIACPDEVTDRVFERVSNPQPVTESRKDHALMTLLKPIWRPVSIAAAAAAVVLMMVSVSVDTEPGPSQAEVDQALREAKYALAVINDAGRRTGAQVGTEVRNTIVAPIKKALTEDTGNGS